MQSWTQFKQCEPILSRIEETYAQLEVFGQQYDPHLGYFHGLTPQEIEEVKAETRQAIRKEWERMPGTVYYWLLPFYRGQFALLLRALRFIGAPDPEQQTEASRQAFYRFFRTLPFAERVVLGLKLDDPSLLRRSETLRSQIDAQKQSLLQRLEQLHGN